MYTELAAEIERRQDDASADQAPIFIFIYDIQRFRDLRKSDDDFGFSRYDEDKPMPPSKLFADVLRDGPPLGIHTIVWCDSVNNLNRTFDRQGPKEFEIRILFQMSANDSSTLIDTPAASKLGENRALFYSEEENRTEKFRPYGVPEKEWLDQVKQKFAARPLPEVPEAPVPANGHGAPTGRRAEGRRNPTRQPVPVPAGDFAVGEGDGNGSSDANGSSEATDPRVPLLVRGRAGRTHRGESLRGDTDGDRDPAAVSAPGASARFERPSVVPQNGLS